MTDDIEDESAQCRYLFTVRQTFGKAPAIDSFYELKMPAGITGDQAKVMMKLNKSWCKDEIHNDTRALSGMQLRLRFNSDMFQHVCLVRTYSPISIEDMDHIVAEKHNRDTLMDFLEESAIK